MKQITIYDLLPLLKKGWVCCTNGGAWWWYAKKPKPMDACGFYDHRACNFDCLSEAFNIAPFDGDWKDSLIKVEHKCSSKCTSSGQVKEYIIHAEDFNPEPTGFLSESQLKRMFEHKEEE